MPYPQRNPQIVMQNNNPTMLRRNPSQVPQARFSRQFTPMLHRPNHQALTTAVQRMPVLPKKSIVQQPPRRPSVQALPQQQQLKTPKRIIDWSKEQQNHEDVEEVFKNKEFLF